MLLQIKSHLPLILIFLFAFFLRIVNLGNMPLYLHQDEIMNGYVGRYILENGVDLHGNRWPILYFDNFGDYPNVIPMYISGAFTYIFGVNAFAIRFPIALIASLAVFPMYYLCLLLYKKKNISLFCALLLAILPWHMVLSRATAENAMAGTVFLTGIWALLTGIQKEKFKFLGVASACFFLSYFLYPGMRLIIPVTLLPTIFLATKAAMRRRLLVLIIAFFGLTFAISQTSWGRARFSQTSVFTFNNQVNNKADHYALSGPREFHLTTRLFNNKPVLYVREIIHQYLSYFSPNYLFTVGGHPDRYLVPDHGLLYLSLLVMLVVACLLPANKDLDIDKRSFLYVLWLTAISVLPSALTLDEVPNVHRSALLGIMLTVSAGYVALKCTQIKWRGFSLLTPFLFLLAFEFCFFMHQYFAQSKSAQAFARYDERTILVKHLIRIQNDWDTIIVPREIFAIYYLFYTQNFDPALAGRFERNLYLPSVGKLHFIDNNCPTSQKEVKLPIKGKTLIVDLPSCESVSGYKMVDVILRTNGSEAYRLTTPFLRPLP